MTSVVQPPAYRSEIKVLVVDDQDAARYAVSRTLRAAGFKTLEAADGAQALELASDASAIVLDVHLPDMNGLEVCRRLRSSTVTAATPIIHLSSVFVTASDVENGLQTGSDAYIVTPFEPAELAGMIDHLVLQRDAA